MSEKNPACPIFWDIRIRNLECPNPLKLPPVDMTRIPIGVPCTPAPPSTRNPYCGCPAVADECFDYSIPNTIETRIHRLPLQCCKPRCDFTIAAIPCPNTRQPRQPQPDPLCFDWTVDEPGPNDSYGLNGLNWYDWKMERYNLDIMPKTAKAVVPVHPGFSRNPPPPGTKVYMCRLPIECYSGEPTPCPATPFKQDVNYFRDWRCCEAMPAQAWVPAVDTWATNQHL